MQLRRCFGAAAILACAASATVEARTAVSDLSHPFSLPFELSADGYVLIQGEVDDMPGVFLFDTGSYLGLVINRHHVPLGSGRYVSGGTVTSGQRVMVESHLGRHVVTLAGRLRVPAAGDATSDKSGFTLSMDGEQQEKNIDGRLIGWIGWGFMRNYRFTIDYAARTIEFFPLRLNTNRQALSRPADVFKTASASPVVPFLLSIAGQGIPATFDTAGWDEMALSKRTWSLLRARNAVTIGPGVACATAPKAYHNGRPYKLADLDRVEASGDRITLGYKFLRGYRSTWDPEAGTVTLEPVAATPLPPARDCS